MTSVADESIRPFKVHVSQEEQDRLIRKLKDTRVPNRDIVDGAGADYGFTTEWATDLYRYWCDEYSWPRVEEEINSWPHYLTDINRQTIPILFIHGWPGSFYEFSQVIDMMRKPEQSEVEARRPEQAFHCVAPDLPGFCFSSGPPRGQTVEVVGEMFHTLMLRLGYKEYVIQCGDYGGWVGRAM